MTHELKTILYRTVYYQQALKSTKAKQKFNQRTFDYKDFPKHIVKIFTDLLHGQLVKIKTKTDAIQLMVFLCFDGALIPERENPVEAQIQSSQFEWKVFRRCKNLLYGISGIQTHGLVAADGTEDDSKLTNIGYAACLFYFLSFKKPELSQIILEISKKTALNYCHHVDLKWSGETCYFESEWTNSDNKMLTFVKDNLDEMHGNSVWTKTKLREIKKIFTKIHSLVDSGPVISS